MNMKYFIIGIIILLVILLAFILGRKKIIPNENELELTYEINSGIPFKWEYEIEDESIVSFARSYVIRNDNSSISAGGRIATNYVFKGLREGKTYITFKYVSIENHAVHKEERTCVKVSSDNKISIVGICD